MNILLTGASRGIGAATLEALTSSGHRVAGHSTRGGEGLIAGDLADPASPNSIWQAALDQLGGRIDVLVNNAGVLVPGLLGMISIPSLRETFETNAIATINLTQYAIRLMEPARGPSIVNVAS